MAKPTITVANPSESDAEPKDTDFATWLDNAIVEAHVVLDRLRADYDAVVDALCRAETTLSDPSQAPGLVVAGHDSVDATSPESADTAAIPHAIAS